MTQIILDQPHTHAGQPYEKGAELDVPQHDAEYLVTAGVARFKQGLQRRAPKNDPPESEASAVAGEPAAAMESTETDAPSPTTD
ncbi:hypothetical protein PY254_10620 [Rhodanobacter sp. AS-Z3]|uniref:DUF7210 family protein n=1 Tax=Rhodanobacter sp. AS-Z3 TaxID=3031330 RepID=UPI00247B11CA|nr:hypothetical protein [Rhodanobacter sp. AS-Z3]WEN13699.1 hypothetical protein PY254_10620 [Rhodanobacter sp. AS-Z3]